jgi:hypothetical protein
VVGEPAAAVVVTCLIVDAVDVADARRVCVGLMEGGSFLSDDGFNELAELVDVTEEELDEEEEDEEEEEVELSGAKRDAIGGDCGLANVLFDELVGDDDGLATRLVDGLANIGGEGNVWLFLFGPFAEDALMGVVTKLFGEEVALAEEVEEVGDLPLDGGGDEVVVEVGVLVARVVFVGEAVRTLGGRFCDTTFPTLMFICGISYLSLKFRANND